ncbi:hypothetical protein [Thiorhodococcus minor]|uniref:Uncharacterized protein n=1 Tax=Thiorhodococcus minor TaxID=57489 RepID=A0A6M0K201_9GAMM|nr:hypothetical protein [Thiorhodococcus minor]NEV62355.1 hypothetical protein [Thiorhodococcus minor]
MKRQIPKRPRQEPLIESILPEPSEPATDDGFIVGDAVVNVYQPRTELGRRLVELRRAHLLGGGKLLDWDEIEAEARERRGGVANA